MGSYPATDSLSHHNRVLQSMENQQIPGKASHKENTKNKPAILNSTYIKAMGWATQVDKICFFYFFNFLSSSVIQWRSTDAV